MEVGIRELRNKLSRYIDRVKEGEEMIVTDRGRAVAKVVPIDGDDVLERLIAEGKVIPARKNDRELPPPIKARGTVSDLVAEQRR